jgi:hypothetical protein
LRNKNRKLTEDKDKLNKAIEDLKKSQEDHNKRLENVRKENKMIIETQKKDTETISRLKRDKDNLTLTIDKLKEENERYKKTINEQLESMYAGSNISSSIIKTQPLASSLPNKKDVMTQTDEDIKEGFSSISRSKIEVAKPVEVKKPEEEEIAAADEVLKRLVYFCLKKNINMMKHLQRYDITKLGKVIKYDFAKAIDEIKLGFIDNDINRLIFIAKPVESYIDIKRFVELMISKDKNYEILIKDQGDNIYFIICLEINFDDANKKPASKKYNPFESKNFNINY